MNDVAMTDVVVVGAGYAGVMAANTLAHEKDIRITLLNPRREFVERIRLHQYVAGSRDALVPLTDVLDPRVTLRVASVQEMTGENIMLNDSSTHRYDYLVYAVGSSVAPPPGTEAVASLEAAQRLRARLDALADGSAVTVVGAGLTGIETASEIAEQRPALRVRLVTDELAPGVSEKGRARIESVLRKLGVDIGLGTSAAPSNPTSDCTVWTGGFVVPDLARRSGLPTDDAGRLLVDETLTCVGNPRIIGVGDAATGLRMSCAAAMPLGVHGANTVIARIRGAQPAPVSVGFALKCISLGRRNGLVDLARKDDTPIGQSVSGRLAAFIKERICCMSVSYLTKPRRYYLLSGPKARVVAR